MRRLTHHPALVTALAYLAFGSAWILLSDWLLAALLNEPAQLTTWQTY